ncbi:YGGT family protein [Streptococcus mitis bv. 2 str. SK95]|jgi:ylmG protein|uniref:Integral membrane protein YggT, involved in response to extracytoplasmic stress (Osmotic shock) n=2 Tax=Streptococcus oralis TaxID=1303 RepID=A0A139M9E9_STROR|nr:MULTISPECIES: YggT family protein [Streptococcus]EGU67474.1 YGGT family protein [Streptococcus mitis bv. 2 str. SK95]KXT60416.1 Integral membrane protein YggT, involved in response to extracytoplasmic stress (osmotic shock) [Streptococcus oralis]RSJ65617.1 YGGT family protein [Streptococcus oralis]SDO97018.1 YggT family protein [Streptococcus sp. NLAE-zl-C503]
MIFLIRLIQNAVNIYSLLLLIYALLSWFPNSYGSSLERLLEKLVRPIVDPLRRLPLQFGGLDLSIWLAILIVRFLGDSLIRFLLII